MDSPRLSFLVAGVQKGGTTALARYLSLHPALALPAAKEAHVFDAPDFDDCWSAEEVDRRFAPHFEPGSGRLMGDATPFTCFQETVVARVARYNPAMRWILLLRDPVDRAISQHQMESRRGREPLPLWRAVLAEPLRLRQHDGDLGLDSPLRWASYAARGRYAAQLRALYRHVPRDQVLLLRSDDLARDPASVLSRVTGFLGVAPLSPLPDIGRVFDGGYRPPGRWSPGRLLLQARLAGETRALHALTGVDLASNALARPGPFD